VHPQDAADEPAPPTFEELENFDHLITSGYFQGNGYKAEMKLICLSWLQFREEELALWIHRYRMSEPELLRQSLLELYKNIVSLYERLDHLCGGSQSYLGAGDVRINEATQKAFDEFVEVWDEMPPLLRNYLLFAKSYEDAYRLGKVINVRAPGLDPNELNKKLFEKLKVLQKALTRLAKGIRDLLKNGP
jgi:hypothetical protein